MRARGVDIGLVVLFVTWQVGERLFSGMAGGPLAPSAACGVVMGAALWWRRADARRAVVVLVAGSAASAAVGATPSDVVATFFEVVLVAYAVGRRLGGRERVVVAAGLGFGIGVIDVVDYDATAIAFPVLLVAAVAFVGALLRDRAELTRELAERTHALDAERERREQEAVLDERRRISRELHDVVAHTVSIMVVQAGGARVQLARDPDRACAALDQVEATGHETLLELDRLFGLLHDAGPVGRLDALDRLAERTRAAGLAVELVVDGDPQPLGPDADLALFRVVQEALTNTLKHGGPGVTARVTVAWSGDAVEVVVRDDGWGTAGTRGEGSRRGLSGMAERLVPHGADVEAGPLAAGGFEVRARMPLAREEVHA